MLELRENEQKTLIALEKLEGKGLVDQIVKISGLVDAAIMRAALTLSEKNLAKLYLQKHITIVLTQEGKDYATGQLVERRFRKGVHDKGGTIQLPVDPTELDIPKDAISVAMAWTIRKKWGSINKKQGTISVINYEPPIGTDEVLLGRLFAKGTIQYEELSIELQKAAMSLKKRKLVQFKETTRQELELTKTGLKLAKKGFKVISEISQLTPELIRTGGWRNVNLRQFNVEASGPTIYPGKIHPVQQVIQQVKEIFLEMGFTEIRGEMVETAFWNFDALFQPQDHPARDMVDTFYLSNPKQGKLPKKSVVDAVAKIHENGWTTGSRGWEYKWSTQEAKKLVLRTHTTATTIRYLTEHKEPPVKVFSVDRVFRNEKLDYKHLAEFHQIEGIIMDRKVTLRDLMGTLKEFYQKLGLEKVQFWPSYFPYTEPSLQSTVYVPELNNWIELCGMGIFRPEVLAPFGVEYPVLAWGGGLERLIFLKLALEDIRLLYKNDLGWIRRNPVCQQ
jgi:phenylalanyl-tRNA synthetase alpha chain